MSEHWFSFSIVILVQLILFLVHAWYERRLIEVPRILIQSIAIGIPFGIAFDLIVGKFVGLYSYELGFGLFFLSINGALSYGLMQANAVLMEKVHFGHFYLWTIAVGLVYEVTNYYFRVWNWEFSTPLIETLIVHGLGYIGLATLMALTWHYVLRRHFAFIERF